MVCNLFSQHSRTKQDLMKGFFKKPKQTQQPNPEDAASPWLEKPPEMAGDLSSNSLLSGMVQEGEAESLLSQGNVLFLQLRDLPL